MDTQTVGIELEEQIGWHTAIKVFGLVPSCSMT